MTASLLKTIETITRKNCGQGRLMPKNSLQADGSICNSNGSPIAPRNRTLRVFSDELEELDRLIEQPRSDSVIKPDALIGGDAFEVLKRLPEKSVDLLFADPPYNLEKKFGTARFSKTSPDEYASWLDSWLRLCLPTLKDTASIYICGDWRSGSAIESVGTRYFRLRNRITWEREKGRGSRWNWKNNSEDIWFFTVSGKFTFNADAVKIRRRVIAPYRENGQPKDWQQTNEGKFRDTFPGNVWTDLTVPFWSMPENTPHPTQKPEKLLARILLASSTPGDTILDPFAGSGTSAVVAKKLCRHFVAIECNRDYCRLAAKRLLLAEKNKEIQGFADNVFWQRNARVR